MSEEALHDRPGEAAPIYSATTFDANAFLVGLDAIYNAHEAAAKAEPFLRQALSDSERANDEAGELTVLNETMGFYRSQGRHDDNERIIQRALELAEHMGLQGSETWTTTLINAATGMRAARQYKRAEDLYNQALESAARTYSPNDRRVAALHNNLSMLYSETGRLCQAGDELDKALNILEATSPDPDTDLDAASTRTNLSLVLLQRALGEGNGGAERDELLEQADTQAAKALEIYRNGRLEHSAHYASALSGYAQVCFARGRFQQSMQTYRRALAVIEECYGKDTDYYRITQANLSQAEQAANKAASAESTYRNSGTDEPRAMQERDAHHGGSEPNGTAEATVARRTHGVASKTGSPRPAMSGLKLSRAYWNAFGKPMIAERFPEYHGRIAAGLVGQGSECWGFDDEESHDHDFGPGFCLWLTAHDYAAVGAQLQAEYDALPQEFLGYGPRRATARAQGSGRRVGVFEIGDFFERLTGYGRAPGDDKPYEWLMLDEATLSAATNGEIFADPLGELLKTRQGFKMMPDDVRLSLISRRLGMISQAGQYNLPRSLKRDDMTAAWLSIGEFVNAVASLVFLINQPITVGYLPYYKWRFAALRRLSARPATRLAQVCEQLETMLRLSSAACFGGAGFGEGGEGAAPAATTVQRAVETICGEITTELKREGLTSSDEAFLEWQRPFVEEHIVSQAACLHSLPTTGADNR